MKALSVLLILNAFIICLGDDENFERHPLTFTGGKCRGLWRSDKLVGKCFGLKLFSEFPELKDVGTIHKAEECRALCCNLGYDCVSWQYQQSTNTCKLGPAVRLGFEGSGTPNWCDPHPPSEWNGRKILSRDDMGSCKWGDKLPYQCFGLGPEVKNSTGGSLTRLSCAEACCKDKTCEMWQEAPGRGCYMSKAAGIFCDSKQGAYEGSRKCVLGFCGGMEDKILPAYYAKLNTTKAIANIKSKNKQRNANLK